MSKRILLLVLVCLGFTGAIVAQSPRSIQSDLTFAGENLVICPVGQENFAGTVSLGAINAQSNDIDLDTMYLCLGDEVNILGNGDAVLTGDPDPSTAAGIGYGFYECGPTITGPDMVTIGGDPCLVTDPPPLNLFYVATQGNLNGDILFFNDGQLINTFNGGDPGLFFFAPITFDSLVTEMVGPDVIYQAFYENGGPCVNVNVDEAIGVVYLNGIAANNIVNTTADGGCEVNFDVSGGLPEYDGSNYDISITLNSDPSIEGFVTTGAATHGDQVSFNVPQPGLYDVVVSDGKSCAASFQVDVASCVAVTMSLPDITAFPGMNVCLPVTVENFNNILGAQFSIVFDDNILSYTGTQNYNPNTTNLGGGNFFNVGNAVNFVWADISPSGSTIPDGEIFFEVCFDVIGPVGTCSPVDFSNEPVFIEVIDENGVIGFVGNNGSVCVSANVLDVTITTEDLSCPGQDDGSFTVTVSDGAVPYDVTWQPLGGGPIQGPGTINTQGGSFTASNLAADSYIVTVEDSGPADNYVDTIEISQGPVLNVIFDQTQANCNGGLGAVTAQLVVDSVVVPNPGPEYVFEWNTGATTQTLPAVPSGIYFVTITDTTSGCFATGNTFLPQTPAINLMIDDLQDATCSGVMDGSITVSVSGGTPDVNGNYEIFWPTVGAGVTDFGTSSTVMNLSDGSYDVIVTDGNGCMDTTAIEVGAVKELSLATANFSNVVCNGACDGSISVDANTVGGVSNVYIFNWVGVPPIPPPGPVNTATNSTVNNLCPGQYTVILTDDAGCQTDTSFMITEPPLLSVSVEEVVDESCNIGDDGSATVSVTGGVYPYGYDWGLPGQTDSIATNLMAGDYTLTVTDANGCIDSAMVSINQPVPPMIISFDNDTLECFDDTNGSLTVVAVPGGSPIIDYNWSTGQNGPVLATINDLGPGEYYVTVTADDACEVIDTALVIAPEPLVLDSFQTSPPLCPGLGGGSISVFVSGGTGPYFYDWSLDAFDGIGFSAIDGADVVAGVYTVEVTDANDCTSLFVEITLDDPPGIEVDFSGIEAVSCFENQGVPCDGVATATAMYSDGASGTFNFIWPSGEQDLGVVSSTAMQLCQEEQIVVVSDGICSVEDTVFIPFPDTLNLGNMIDITDVTCNGFADGEASISAQGGTPPYNFVWSNMDTGPMVTGLMPGTYGVTITDDNGCMFQTTIPIDEPDPLVAFVDMANTLDSVSCFGAEDGVLTVTAQGGNLNISPNLTYNWAGGIAPPTSSAATGLAAGTYSVTVSDFLGCSDELEYTIGEPAPIFFDLGAIASIPCTDSTTTISIDTAFGGNGQALFWYSFSVDNASPQPIDTEIEVFGGEHLIEVFDLDGCSSDTTIFLPEPPPILLEYPEVVEVELGDSIQLQPTVLASQFPLLADSIFWTPTTFLRFEDNLLEPYVRPLETTDYTILAFDVNGCPVVATTRVLVDKDRNVYIPNVFTPDGDGINDYFNVFAANGVANIPSIRVFDRWGDLVFDTYQVPPSIDPSPDHGWDGTFNGKKMNSGVYVYLVEVEFEDGEVLLYRGDITLVR